MAKNRMRKTKTKKGAKRKIKMVTTKTAMRQSRRNTMKRSKRR